MDLPMIKHMKGTTMKTIQTVILTILVIVGVFSFCVTTKLVKDILECEEKNAPYQCEYAATPMKGD